MTENEARSWVTARHGSVGLARMEQLVTLVSTEASEQNLIAPSTIKDMWSRHIVDSLQLLEMPGVANADGVWLDIGSGAGFPGLAIACFTNRPVVLIEPRKRRAEFLARAVDALGLASHVDIIASRVEAVRHPAAVISARAVGFMGDLFAWASNCATKKTLWVLPKGRTARDEVASAQIAWHGVFHVEQSITDPDSLIVLASKVAKR